MNETQRNSLPHGLRSVITSHEKNNQIILLLAVFLLISLHAADDPWKPFQFVVGDWVGTGTGKPGEGAGGFSLKPELGNKVLVRRNRAEYPPQQGQSRGVVHEDLMIIYPAEGSEPFRAEYFDSEGHVIRYKVTPSEDKIVFLSDGPATAPRFRLTYTKKSESSLEIGFEMAPPNQDFRRYLNGTVTRK